MTQMEGYVTEGDNTVTVVLDTNLTPELIEEGYVNEIISKLQTMRKDSGFDVTDHIAVYVSENDKIQAFVQKNEEDIAKIVLGDKFIYGSSTENAKSWDINGEKVTLSVEKL